MIAMSLSLGQPIWLLLALPCAATLLLWRLPSRMMQVMRVVVCLIIVIALADPAVLLPSRSGTVIVVADRSRSMPRSSERVQLESIRLIQEEMHSDDRLGVVTFGAAPLLECAPQRALLERFEGEPDPDATNLADALDMAVSLVPRGAPGRIVVLSDGRWSGSDPQGEAAKATMRNLPIDFRLLERPVAGDVAIRSFDAPDLVAPGEAYTMTAWVDAPVPGEVQFELSRGDTVIASGTRDLSTGLHRLVFRDQAEAAGAHAYRLEITPSGSDPVPENNAARRLVGVDGPRPLLHVVQGGESGLVRLLAEGKLDVVARAPEDCRWSLEDISQYSCVILENVPAQDIGEPGMRMIATWVREAGGGLMMTGGKSAYSTGGYFRSPLEPVLPVSMELRQEHRKMALAMVIAMDRSGSMAMPAGGGGRTKMDLANLGAAEVVQMLTAMDEVGVIAVDSTPHTIVDLTPVDDPDRIASKILKVDSQGGGIFVFEALSASAAMLQTAQAETRHIILFADASDSENPQDYKRLLAECRKAGITCSVIGLGAPTDTDAKLLEDIAKRGDGRCYFTNIPTDLPRLFAQDTFVVARSAFLEEPVAIKPLAGLVTLTGQAFSDPPPIGGYNLTYLRPEANLGAATMDEYDAPVVASWQAGIGRVLCYTGQADGDFTGPIAAWQDVGRFFSSLARWSAGRASDLPTGMLLTQEIRDGACRIRLHLDPERDDLSLTTLPLITTLRDEPGMPTDVTRGTLRWIDAATLGIDIPLRGDETVASTVTLDADTSVSLRPTCLPYSPEYQPADGERGRRTLELLAAATDGIERIDLGGVWNDLPKHPRRLAVGPWLLLLAAMLFLLEIFERRTGMLAGLGRRVRRGRATVAEATGEATPGEREDSQARGRLLLGWLRRRRYRKSIAGSKTAATRPDPSPSESPAAQGASKPAEKMSEEKKPGEEAAGMLDALKRAQDRAADRRR